MYQESQAQPSHPSLHSESEILLHISHDPSHRLSELSQGLILEKVHPKENHDQIVHDLAEPLSLVILQMDRK
jgi:hypothetical protein